MVSSSVDDLFQLADDLGDQEGTPVFSDDAKALMDDVAIDFGLQIDAGLGVSPDDLKAEEPLLVAFILDDSPSITDIDNGPQAVCEGHSLYLDTLGESKEKNGILIGTWLLNEDMPVHPFVALDNAPRLVVGDNYKNHGMTPLYRKVCEVLTVLNLKMQVEYFDAGCTCRAIIVIVTDGRNEVYRVNKPRTADECRILIEELGELAIVQFMGIDDGHTSFRDIAMSMGVRPTQIMLPGADPHEIRVSFDLASRSALSASQHADTFSQVAMKGFTA